MSQESIFSFVFREEKNRKLVLIILAANILQLLLFKFLYPFSDYFPDTSLYVYAAAARLDINIYPIGYSKFLLAFHQLTHSDTAIVIFQYLLLELSCLYMYFTVSYFYSPGKSTRYSLLAFLFFNPIFLYLSNHITSDALFAALSVWWLTELLWIIHRPRLYQLFTQSILLFFCFTIRNNAYIYPLLSIVSFALSGQNFKRKLAGMALPFFLIVPFIIHTRHIAEELTGTKQFSLFTGWQLANNALYMYRHIEVDSTKLPSGAPRELNRISRKTFKHVDANFDAIVSDYDANFFIKEPGSPLKQYYFTHYHPNDEYENIRDWGHCSASFEKYGQSLIKQHPMAFARYFLLPNITNYFFPPLEKLKKYNNNEDEMYSNIQDWFDYKTPDISAVSWTAQGQILFIYQYIFFFLHVLMAGSVFWLFSKRKIQSLSREFKSTLLLVAVFLLLNFSFCVSATIIVLRYEFFPMIILFVFPLILIEALDKKETLIRKEGEISKRASLIPGILK